VKLINTTDYSDTFLRRMVSWCCKELGLPVRRLKQARFGNSCRHWGGLAYWRSRIGVRVVGDDCNRELKHWKFRDGFQVVTNSRLEVLLLTTAHELAHIEQFWRLGYRSKGLERHTEGMAYTVLKAFRIVQDALVAEWSREPEGPVKVAPSVQERRQQAVMTKLATWQRKMKLARTKVAKYQRQVRYYEKVIAAKKG
jgi:hypothetical protein